MSPMKFYFKCHHCSDIMTVTVNGDEAKLEDSCQDLPQDGFQ